MISEVLSSTPWAVIATLGALVAAMAGLLKIFVPPREEDLLRDWSMPPPKPIFWLGTIVLPALEAFKRAVMPPPLYLMQRHIMGFMYSQTLYAVASLGVADALAKGPKSAAQLAKELGANEDWLYRVMRAAVQIGVFEVVKGRYAGAPVKFRNNSLSVVLREDHPNCMKYMATHQMEDNWPAWSELAWGVRTGGLTFNKSHNGLAQFPYFQANPAQEDKFSKAMASVNHLGTAPVVEDYPWAGHKRIIDVGGAYGSFIASLLERHSGLQGILFDQEQVIARAPEVWASKPRWSAVKDRLTFTSGDFFKPETLPAGKDGDAYVMRLILHDWNDEDTVTILSNLRKAMGTAKTTLLLVETCVANEFNDPLMTRGILDVHMLVALNGAERTQKQWRSLLSQAGFEFRQMVPTRGVFSVVEAVPV